LTLRALGEPLFLQPKILLYQSVKPDWMHFHECRLTARILPLLENHRQRHGKPDRYHTREKQMSRDTNP
jgi:hypothetical protein